MFTWENVGFFINEEWKNTMKSLPMFAAIQGVSLSELPLW